MQLEGRRKSTNVEDRRRGGAAAAGGIGLGGLIIVGLIMLLTGQDPSQVLSYIDDGSLTTTQDSGYVESTEDQQLYDFSVTILAGTEDIWSAIFKQNGLTYTAPKLVLFNGSVQSGCGGATASTGPFYCSADQCIYLDLSFFKTMKQQFGTTGDFAWAYVIAHEVGHHVQHLLGTLNQVNQKRARSNEKAANQLSVRLELQADFYAGIWAHYDNKRFGSLEEGDIEEGIRCANAIGDDILQKNSYGYTVPDAFTHGTAQQRVRWLKKGLDSGNPALGDTFSPRYSEL